MNILNYARKYFNKEHHIREKLIKIKNPRDRRRKKRTGILFKQTKYTV